MPHRPVSKNLIWHFDAFRLKAYLKLKFGLTADEWQAMYRYFKKSGMLTAMDKNGHKLITYRPEKYVPNPDERPFIPDEKFWTWR